MKKVWLYTALLLGGLVASQFLPALSAHPLTKWITMACLAFIMIHVGLEFELDKTRWRSYGVDYLVAATAAAFPWLFVAGYFAKVFGGPDGLSWTESLLVGRFAAPTSAGVLFAMLAAAGLAGTWVFKKARVLAIFDDLDTVLLMIPLKMMIVGMKPALALIALAVLVLLVVAWRGYRTRSWPTSWPWVLGYAVLLTVLCEGVYLLSKAADPQAPIHLEVLLPAFVLGCLLKTEGHTVSEGEERASMGVSAVFMALVGFSMPPLGSGAEGFAWGTVFGHVAIVTILSNLGKMAALFFYKKEASWRERLAVSLALWPRGEVGAGVLVVSLGYGLGGMAVTVALLSLALNLAITGLIILGVKSLIQPKA